jgi:myo-inositol-1(or 4)-monophosphatase
MNDLELAQEAAAVGASIVAEWAGRFGDADLKGAVNPVTQADHESEQAILELLTTHRPDDAIVGEEGANRAGTSGRRWLIDPLDGTVNFVHGVPQVAVTIAVEDGDGAIAGVIRDVFRGHEYTATRGGGSFRDGERIRASACTDLAAALVATGFPYDRNERGREYGRIVGEVLMSIQGIRRAGSAALDMAWVASGIYDAYFEQDFGPWDIAAGILIVREAGGIVTGFDGTTPVTSNVVSAAPGVHAALQQVVAAAVAG